LCAANEVEQLDELQLVVKVVLEPQDQFGAHLDCTA
jgi:hypothetical protein